MVHDAGEEINVSDAAWTVIIVVAPVLTAAFRRPADHRAAESPLVMVAARWLVAFTFFAGANASSGVPDPALAAGQVLQPLPQLV